MVDIQSAVETEQSEISADELHRIARVEAVWSAPPPAELTAQWARYPLSHPIVQQAMNRRVTGDPHRDPYGRLLDQLGRWGYQLPLTRVASLCCGAGQLERGLFEIGILSSCRGFDLASGAIDAARDTAVAEGKAGLAYERRDLENDGLGLNGLDLVVAHQGVHHISGLEAVFDAVSDALSPAGLFHLHEFVGPDRFQWTDRQLEEMTAWLQSLPPRYRVTANGGERTSVARPTIEEMIADDPSEAVRSSCIEPLFMERFDLIERRPMGGTLCMMALADIAGNFNPEAPEDAAHLKRLLDREDELIATGELGSDFVVLLGRKRLN